MSALIIDSRQVLSAIVGATETRTNFNSTTYTASAIATLPLPVGVWFVTSRAIVSDSANATAGTKAKLVFSGTASVSGEAAYGNQAPDALDPPSFPTFLGWPAGNLTGEMAFAAGAVGQDITRTLKLTVTVAGSLAISYAQNTANNSNLKLYLGSYILARKS